MYWSSKPKTSKASDDDSEGVGRREPQFVVHRSSTTSSMGSQAKAPPRVPLTPQRFPVLNKALQKHRERKLSARGAPLPNAEPEKPPVQEVKSDVEDGFLLQMDPKHNACVHEKGKPCPNDICLLARNEEKKTSSMSQVFTLTRPSSLISKLKDAMKTSTSSADSKNKSAPKGKNTSQAPNKVAPPTRQSVDKSSKRPSDGATARIHDKVSGSSSTRASDNVSGAESPSKVPAKPAEKESVKSKKSTGTRRCSGGSAAKPSAPIPNKGNAQVVHKAAKRTAIPAGKISVNRAKYIIASKKKAAAMASGKARGKVTQEGVVPRPDGGKRRTSDPKGSGKVPDKSGAKTQQDQIDSEKAGANVEHAQREDKAHSDKTSEKGSDKSSDGNAPNKSPLQPKDAPDKNQGPGRSENVGDGGVPNAGAATKSGSLASGTSTSSSRGMSMNIVWPDISTCVRALFVSLLALVVVVVVLLLLFPETIKKLVALLLRMDARSVWPQRPQGHLLDTPCLSVNVAPLPSGRITGGDHKSID